MKIKKAKIYYVRHEKAGWIVDPEEIVKIK